MSRPAGLTVLAVVGAALGTLLIIGAFLFLDQGNEPTLVAVVIGAGALWLGFAYGAWNLRRWAWPLGLLLAGIVGASALVNYLSGRTAYALVGLIAAVLVAGYLSRAEARAAFRSSSRGVDERTPPPDDGMARQAAATRGSTPGRVAVVAVPTGLLGAFLLVAGVAALASGDEQVAFSILATAMGVALLIVAYGLWRLRRWGWLAGFVVAAVVALSAILDEASDVTSRALGVIVAVLIVAGLWWIRGPFRRRRDDLVAAREQATETEATSAKT